MAPTAPSTEKHASAFNTFLAVTQTLVLLAGLLGGSIWFATMRAEIIQNNTDVKDLKETSRQMALILSQQATIIAVQEANYRRVIEDLTAIKQKL